MKTVAKKSNNRSPTKLLSSSTPVETDAGMDDWTGWLKETRRRQDGKKDVYWYTPNRMYKLRSRVELRRYVTILLSDKTKDYQKAWDIFLLSKDKQNDNSTENYADAASPTTSTLISSIVPDDTIEYMHDWDGWLKETWERKDGKRDVYWYTPGKKYKFRSRVEVTKYTEFLKEEKRRNDFRAWLRFRKDRDQRVKLIIKENERAYSDAWERFNNQKK